MIEKCKGGRRMNKMNDKERIKAINARALRVLCHKYDNAEGGLPDCQGEGIVLFRFFQRLLRCYKKEDSDAE